MRIEIHLEKAGRVDALRHRLDPLADFELWFWASMVAAVNAVNAALHAQGVTEGGDGREELGPVYYERCRAGALPQPMFHTYGDLLGICGSAIERLVPPALAGAVAAWKVFPEVRDPCVRGDAEITQAIVERVEATYRQCMDAARTVLEAEKTL
jgi:hypothetical protein